MYLSSAVRTQSAVQMFCVCRNCVYPYVKITKLYECPESRSTMALLYDPAAASYGYWSFNDTVWVSCSPASRVFTNNPRCVVAYNTFLAGGYTVNGAMFCVVFGTNGGGAMRDGRCCGS